MTDDLTSAGRTTGPSAAGPPPASVSVFLVSLGRRAQEAVDGRLREHGLSYHHLSALGHLHRQPGLSYSELARRARVTVQSMQATVAHLEDQQLVDRGAATSRGRRADLRVTERGAQVLTAAETAVRAVDEQLLDGLSDSQRGQLEGALQQMFIAGAASAGGTTKDRPHQVEQTATGGAG